MSKFTAVGIKNLPPKEKTYTKTEGQGLYIQVSPKGFKTWYYHYRFRGKQRWFRLGNYPTVSLKDARERREKVAQILSQDIDPIAKAALEREERDQSITVSELVDEYIEKWAKPRKRTWREDERNLHTDVLPRWGKRKAKDITKRDVIFLLDSVHERAKEKSTLPAEPTQSRSTFSIVRRKLNFAVERDILKYIPCWGVKPPAKPNRRSRYLSEEEIKTFWTNIDLAPISSEIIRALKLILVTAQRPGEVIGLHWSEIDGDWWIIPAHRTKNGREHRVYLTQLAQELLGECNDGYIFKSPTSDKTIHVNAVAQAVRLNRKILGIEDKIWTPHDLRRTAATHMAKLGVAPHVLGKILNHVDSSVTAIYNHYDYDEEKKLAMRRWGKQLASTMDKKS